MPNLAIVLSLSSQLNRTMLLRLNREYDGFAHGEKTNQETSPEEATHDRNVSALRDPKSLGLASPVPHGTGKGCGEPSALNTNSGISKLARRAMCASC